MSLTHDAPKPASDAAGSPEQWVGLEELTNDPSFQEMLHREFPEDATAWADPVTRRSFLTLSAASVALAGIGCSPRPASREKIYPYVRQPEQLTLGLPLFFATGFTLGGVTTGVLAKSREGRPVKLEGNPSHPSSTGAIDAITQASLLDLYDPDRSRGPFKLNNGTTWENAYVELRAALEKLKADGKQIRLLTETVGSPSLGGLIDEFLKVYPTTKWVQFDPVSRDNVREAGKTAYGEDVNTVYDFTKALRVVSLDSDFLTCGPGSVRYSRDFNSKRNAHLRQGDKVPTAEEMNRLYVVESMLTATGSVADHRLPIRSADVEGFARALAKALGVANEGDAQVSDAAKAWIAPLVADLQAHKGASVIIAGDHQPVAVHALAHAMNAALGNIGSTVLNFAPSEHRPTNQANEFKELVTEMADGKVAAIFILGANPVYTAPADIDFATALSKVPLRVHLGQYQDETALQCTWHLNEAHYLESWGDGRAHDGLANICQPLIAPLFGGRSALDLVANLIPERVGGLTAREIVKDYWKKNWPANGSTGAFSDSAWQRALQEGVIPNSAKPRVDKPPTGAIPAYKAPASGIEINFRADPAVHDGRFANNGWLQELPKPITKLTWDNAAIVGPKFAKGAFQFDIESTGGGEHGRAVARMAELTVRGKKLKVAVWVQPGHADDSITLHLGYGRGDAKGNGAGKVARGTGFNSYTVRSSEAPWTDVGAKLDALSETYILASTQAHWRMEGRRPVRGATRDEYQQNYDLAKAEKKPGDHTPPVALFAKVPPVAAPEWRDIDDLVPGNEARANKHAHVHGKKDDEHKDDEHHDHDSRKIPLSIVPPTNKEGRRWAMAIDLTACNGCSACLTACMAENNTAVVGKKEVTRGREMHWIRVDRYYEFINSAKEKDGAASKDDPSNIAVHFQPVPCQQCEKAPCEIVCPVAATMHSADGLNDMVYNRCVGTRYCSNNCPYKVRRFNFLTFADWKTDTYKLMRNPEVTVRERGVMEKCTYCVQRIRAAEIEAERQGRPIRDGEIVTACEAACPAGAIVFGDLSDPKSRVNTWKAQPTNYGLLAELNTMPRTTYLAAIRNPNPAMPKGA